MKKKKAQKTRVSTLSPPQNCENEGSMGVNPTVQPHRKTRSARLTGSLEPSGILLYPGPFYHLLIMVGWLIFLNVTALLIQYMIQIHLL